MRWRASSYGGTSSDRATESYGIRHDCAYVDGHTDRYAGAADADAANTSGSIGNRDAGAANADAASTSDSNANYDAHAQSNVRRDSDTDRTVGARVA